MELAFSAATTGAVGQRPWVGNHHHVCPLRPNSRPSPTPRHGNSRHMRATALFNLVTSQATILHDGDNTLEAFAKAVHGEWDGFEAEFDANTGTPRVIPQLYIPEEFVEWGMLPAGFQSVHSVILRGTALYHKHFRILPNVTHFADHVDLEENLTTYQVADDPGFLAFPNGSFSAGAHKVLTQQTKSILDKSPAAYLVLRHNGQAVHADVKFDFANREFAKTIRVVKERYSCTYCDGGNIEGSSGFVDGWYSEPTSRPELLAGEWISTSPEKHIRRPAGGPPPAPRKHVYLPDGIDVSIQSTADGGVSLQLGWLVEPSKRLLLTRSYETDGTVVSSSIHLETKMDA